MSEPKNPRTLALARLAAREVAASDLRAYLRRKGVEPGEAAETVAQLESRGLVDDSRFARALARDLSLKGKGPLALAARLRARGIALGMGEIRALMREASDSDDERGAVRALVERRHPLALQGDERELARAWSLLLRRGFTRDVVARVLREPAEAD
jgi:SOS response regulatory protein OraA/RecX